MATLTASSTFTVAVSFNTTGSTSSAHSVTETSFSSVLPTPQSVSPLHISQSATTESKLSLNFSYNAGSLGNEAWNVSLTALPEFTQYSYAINGNLSAYASNVELITSVLWHTQDLPIGDIGENLPLYVNINEIALLQVFDIFSLNAVTNVSTIGNIFADVDYLMEIYNNSVPLYYINAQEDVYLNLVDNEANNLIPTFNDSSLISLLLYSVDSFKEISYLGLTDNYDTNLVENPSSIISPISYEYSINLEIGTSNVTNIYSIASTNFTELNLVENLSSQVFPFKRRAQVGISMVTNNTTQVATILVHNTKSYSIVDPVTELQENPVPVSISECIIYTKRLEDLFSVLSEDNSFDSEAQMDNFPVTDSEPIRIGVYNNYSLNTFRTLNDRYN